VRYNVVSFSTGKDSVPTALIARETEPFDSIRLAFADTGNEHETVYEYRDYFAEASGLPIITVKADLSELWWRRRDYVRDVYPAKLVQKDGFSSAEASAIIARCLRVLDKGPTGNPYLDLCVIKGRFPSRRAQFCTDFLKTRPLVEYQLDLLREPGDAVWSWQGVRYGESSNRAHLRGTGACAKTFEDRGGGIFVYRPIVRWKASDCFDAMAYFGIKPNPLYRQGMNRVGCMPCINASKDEILEISKRFPEHVDRIAEWEEVVKMASKRGGAPFFPAPNDGRGERVGRDVRAVVRWAHTSRGGKQIDMMRAMPSEACASSYGLCETAEEVA